MTAFLILGAVVALIALGLPVAVAIGGTGIVLYLLADQAMVLPMLPQRMYAAGTSFTLLAIPFFVMAGTIMNTAGITDRLFRLASVMVGRMRGGLGQVNVLASLLFSGMSGAAVADAAGLGQVEIRAMQKSGYGLGFSAAVTAASSTIGPIFPPSVPFVIYGGITGVSVVQLFLAGVVPGLLMTAVMMVAVAVTARLRNYPREARPTLREATVAVLGGVLPLGAPALLIGGLLGGLFTPTEAGVVACAYALFLGMVVYREITWRHLPGILWSTARSTAVIMFVIAASGFFGWMLTHQRVPDALVSGLLSVADGPMAATMLMLAVLLVLGMFIEGVAIIVITTPLFMPVVQHFGIDPLQFGVMLVLTTAIGLLTPPVGMVLFAICTVCRVRMGELVAELWPYLLGILVVTLLVAFIPAVSTLLPHYWAR